MDDGIIVACLCNGSGGSLDEAPRLEVGVGAVVGGLAVDNVSGVALSWRPSEVIAGH